MTMSEFFTNLSEKIKEAYSRMDIQQWIEKIKSSTAGTIALYFGAFFAVGFLFKKYFKFLLGCIFITVALLMILKNTNVITFDWNAFYRLMRINPADMKVDTIFESAFHWIKSNLLIFISSVSGFIIGYKLG